jgi:WD40 repeat protein
MHVCMLLLAAIHTKPKLNCTTIIYYYNYQQSYHNTTVMNTVNKTIYASCTTAITSASSLTPLQGPVHSVSFSSNSKYLVSAHHSGRVILWDLRKKDAVKHWVCTTSASSGRGSSEVMVVLVMVLIKIACRYLQIILVVVALTVVLWLAE